MRTVLIVEDHADTLHVLLKLVGLFGYRAVGAASGEAGMAAIASEKPDLIVVDGMMPGMNGIEFIRLCRTNAETATIPIIVNTAIGDPHFSDDALRKGANEVWVKGEVGMEQMRERLGHHLRP